MPSWSIYETRHQAIGILLWPSGEEEDRVKNRENKPVVKNEEYALASHFCELFVNELESLYQLAFLLTGSSERAEKCLVEALEDCKKAKVFKPWAKSWSRLAVIERAIKSMSMEPGNSWTAAEFGSPEQAAITNLKGLDRFVYVLSVLEKYSVRDCAILLRTHKREITEAQVRALKEVSTFVNGPLTRTQSAVQLSA